MQNNVRRRRETTPRLRGDVAAFYADRARLRAQISRCVEYQLSGFFLRIPAAATALSASDCML